MESIVIEIFYRLSTAFFWPVAVALLVLFALSLADLGALLVQARRRAHTAATDLPAVANALAARLPAPGSGRSASLDDVALSPSLARFWALLQQRLAQLDSHEHLDLWLDETLQREEIRIANRLDLSRTLVRIAPCWGWPAPSSRSGRRCSRCCRATWAAWSAIWWSASAPSCAGWCWVASPTC